MRRVLAGLTCGIAGGFATWAFLVRVDVPYHYGNNDRGAEVVRQACIAAGLLWLRCALVGAAAGSALGLVAGRLLGPAAVVATGAYVLAFRSVCGSAWPVVPVLGVAVALAWRTPRDAAPDASLLALHACLSFTAAHLMLQLPYYVGLLPAFMSGVGSLVRALVPWTT